MNVSFMRSVDYWVGIPLCALCSAWNAILKPFRSGRANQGSATTFPAKVLFIELSEMGSAIIAYPSIKYVKENYPDATISFLIFNRHRESVELFHDLVNVEVLTIRDEALSVFLFDTVKMVVQLWRKRFDTVIDLELFSRFTALLSYFSGAKNRVGFYRYNDEGLYRGSFLSHKVSYNNLQHMGLNFLSLVKSLSCAAEKENRSLPFLKERIDPTLLELPKLSFSVNENLPLYQKLSTVRGKLFIFNPDPGALPLRGWPEEYYWQLAQGLLRVFPDASFAVVGVGEGGTYSVRMSEEISAVVIDLTGLTPTLKDLLTVLERGTAFITSDSGPAHIAALTSTPSFVFFGPETPVRYRPLGDNIEVLYADLSCSPCYSAANHRSSQCTFNRCVQIISPESVLDTIVRKLDKSGGGS